MLPIEPGTYRIVNILCKKAIAVPNYDHWAIIGQQVHNESNQKWFVQLSGEGYRFKNCLYGHYITIGSTEWSARAYLGQYPPTWKILQHGEGIHVIQYGDFDRVLDMHQKREPSDCEIHIWPRHDLRPQKQWKFERLSDSTGDQDERTQREIKAKNEQITAKTQEIAEKDRLIAQQGEQLVQKNQQLVEQAAQIITQSHQIIAQSQHIVAQGQQIATQSQQLVEQSRELFDQGRRLVKQSRELAERSEGLAQKDEEMMRGYNESGDKLAWVAQRENTLRRQGDGSKLSQIDIQNVELSVQEEDVQREEQREVAALKEKLEQLEHLVVQMKDRDAKKPNNIP